MLLRLPLYLILSYYLFTRHGWAIGAAFAWLFFWTEGIWLYITNPKLRYKSKRPVTKETIDALTFTDDPVTLDEMILIQKTTEGNLEAMKALLESRCDNKSFDFGVVPIDLLSDLPEQVTSDIMERDQTFQAMQEDDDGDITSFFDRSQEIH